MEDTLSCNQLGFHFLIWHTFNWKQNEKETSSKYLNQGSAAKLEKHFGAIKFFDLS